VIIAVETWRSYKRELITMTKKEKEDWKKSKDFESAGIETHKRPGVYVDGPRETPKHLFVKAMLGLVLTKKDRKWDTEVKVNSGRIDVLSFGDPDSEPVAYEVETNVTPKRARQKANQYAIGRIRDVLVIDPQDTPDDPEEAVKYLENNVVL
jgi:hypothetical protein